MSSLTTQEKLHVFDTTLLELMNEGLERSVLRHRDAVIDAADHLKFDYVGVPARTAEDYAFISKKRTVSTTLTAVASSESSRQDHTLHIAKSILDTLCILATVEDPAAPEIPDNTRNDLLNSFNDQACSTAYTKNVLLQFDNFFDDYRADPNFTLQRLLQAQRSGARWIVLSDTSGGCLPTEISTIVKEATRIVPGAYLGIRAYNDTENAIANTFAAIQAGARLVAGSLNGIGIRCGAANLISIVCSLKLKANLPEQYSISVPNDKLKHIAQISREMGDRLNRPISPYAPYVGKYAFAVTSSRHAEHQIREPSSYEHVDPHTVGNRRLLPVSDQSATINLLTELERIGIRLNRDDERLPRLLEELGALEERGYDFDYAKASFELWARGALGILPHYFDVPRYEAITQQRITDKGERSSTTTAVVRLMVDGNSCTSAAEHQGPINALDIAIRGQLGRHQKTVERLELTDCNIEVLSDRKDGASIRVSIERQDEANTRWITQGVSSNFFVALFRALTDSITYKLLLETLKSATDRRPDRQFADRLSGQ